MNGKFGIEVLCKYCECKSLRKCYSINLIFKHAKNTINTTSVGKYFTYVKFVKLTLFYDNPLTYLQGLDPLKIPLTRHQFGHKNYLQTKKDTKVANLKSCLSSFLEIFKLGMFLEFNSTAIFIISVSGMPVKRIQISYGTKYSRMDQVRKTRATLKSCSFPINRPGETKNSHEPPAGRFFIFFCNLFV